MHDIGVRQWGPYQRLHPPEANSCPHETSQAQTARLPINLFNTHMPMKITKHNLKNNFP
jgi:hypothetical protein